MGIQSSVLSSLLFHTDRDITLRKITKTKVVAKAMEELKRPHASWGPGTTAWCWNLMVWLRKVEECL